MQARAQQARRDGTDGDAISQRNRRASSSEFDLRIDAILPMSRCFVNIFIGGGNSTELLDSWRPYERVLLYVGISDCDVCWVRIRFGCCSSSTHVIVLLCMRLHDGCLLHHKFFRMYLSGPCRLMQRRLWSKTC